MAEESHERLSGAGKRAFKVGLIQLSDALALAWIALVFMALAVPPLLVETVVLGEGWPAFSATLETSLRWQFGHVPHLDYHTPIGIAYWLGQGLAVEAIGLDPKSGLAANLITGAVIALAGLFLVRPRLTGLTTAVLMTGIVLLILSLRPLDAAGGVIGDISGSERTGLAIVAVLLVTFFLEPRNQRRPVGAALESLLVAGFLVWLVYLDAYFAALVLLCGAAAMAFPSASRGLILEAVAFAALACVGIGFLTGIGIPYLVDIKAAIAAAPVLQISKLISDIQANLIPLATVIAALGFYVLLNRTDRQARTDTVAVTVVLVFASVLVMNRIDAGTLPLIFVILVVLTARARFTAGAPQQSRQTIFSKLHKMLPAYVPALAAAIALVGWAGGADLLSLKKYLSVSRDDTASKLCEKAEIPACSIWLLSGDRVDTSLLPNPSVNAAGTAVPALEEAQTIDDYIALCGDDAFCLRRSVYAELVGLLNQVMEEGDKPLLLGVANPLPYYYDIEPPRNVLAILAPGRTVSLKHHPSAGTLFSDASILVVPNSERNPDYRGALLRFYEGGMARMFEVVVETDAWSIHRKLAVR